KKMESMLTPTSLTLTALGLFNPLLKVSGNDYRERLTD
ncbi:MAG: hypothetical protein ACI87Q_001471, partial [Pseudohongiellaceae bacterium]